MNETVNLALSPDADDAFMFYALAEHKLTDPTLSIKLIRKDIESLNQEALSQKYEISAISFAVYPQIADHYYLTNYGASMGINYGPIIIAGRALPVADLHSCRIAIPGRLTSAFLALRLYQPAVSVIEMPFDQIIGAVESGSVDAGLLIHEGQLTFAGSGLKKIVDLGQWWHERTNLPLPLGGNVIRKNLGDKLIARLNGILKASIVYGLGHREEALTHAMRFGRQMSRELCDRYVHMYVNEMTVDLGQTGRQALTRLFEEAFEGGLLDKKLVPEFVG